MTIIDFRNKNVSEYRFAVIGNSNFDRVYLYSGFPQFATDCSIYLKVRSNEDNYVDKIAIVSEDISVDDGALLCKWTMGAVSTQCKKLYLQLQFERETGEIIAQTGIVGLTLADTINVDELIPIIYPQVLKELKKQINELKKDSYALATMNYVNDTLTLVFKNKANETLLSLQVNIPTSDKFPMVEYEEGKTLGQLPEEGYLKGYNLFFRKEAGLNNRIFVYMYSVFEQYSMSGIRSDVEARTIDYYLEHATKNEAVLKTNERYVVYANNDEGVQQTIASDEEEGSFVRRDEYDQIDLPFAPTENTHATNKKYVDDKIEDAMRNSYKEVDITEYPTLEDFLESTGEEGYMYLYPIDTTDLTKGYYRYIWENNAWVDLGTTQMDLTGYTKKAQNETITGSWTFNAKQKFDGTNGFDVGYGSITYNSGFIFNSNIRPASNNSYDLGSSSYYWKDIYLAGKLIFNSANNDLHINSNTLVVKVNGSDTYVMASGYFSPNSNGVVNLGLSSFKWKDLYLSGSLSDGTYSYTIDSSYKILHNFYESNNNLTELNFRIVNICSKSADTTFTLRTAPTSCYPEYKAIITNSHQTNAITLTFTSVTKIICNDDNCVINGNAITIPSGTSIECSILNGKMVAINWDN